jgi:ABC-type nitrate/sulfonate/bicarbonate transport system permease component
MRHLLPSAITTTIAMTLTGFAVGSSFGILFGMSLSFSRTLRDLFALSLDFLRPIPIFAVIPLFILWFGIGRTPQIAVIALGTSVIMGVTTIEAIRNVPPIYIKAAHSLGAPREAIYRTVILYAISPHLLGAIRVAAAASWGLDVAAEFIGSQNGLGYLIIVRQSYLDTSGVLVVVLIYCFLAIIFDRLILTVGRRLLRWTPRAAASRDVATSLLGTA